MTDSEKPALDDTPMIFLHGLVSSGQGFKGTLFRRVLPGILTPDFTGSLEERMAQLAPIVADRAGWVIIGSSFGGLMATLFARAHPQLVRKLILLAPALALSEHALDPHPPITITTVIFHGKRDTVIPLDPHPPITIPTVIFHGERDTVIPLEPLREVCEQLFDSYSFNQVDDDHRLHRTVESLDWPSLVSTG